jgi:ABC-type phosphate transport system permease subunit
MLFALPIALYLQTYLTTSGWAQLVRLALDVLWGIPSIVYGAFWFYADDCALVYGRRCWQGLSYWR